MNSHTVFLEANKLSSLLTFLAAVCNTSASRERGNRKIPVPLGIVRAAEKV